MKTTIISGLLMFLFAFGFAQEKITNQSILDLMGL